MQKAYDNVVSLANIEKKKTILDEFKGFNPFNLLKHSWHCLPIFSVGCCMM
jgi:hypothetical protein